ncbi:MAG TPA: LCP family protein [Nocardioidaceae bacterium]|nr:LCP family protein [Nocardioidaceae bacterium]
MTTAKFAVLMRHARRVVVLGVMLALVAVVIPDSGRQRFDASLVKVDGVSGLDTDPGVVWILALGSDARPGQPVLSSRADTIQLVGFNPRTGYATIIGVPRDSYVDIPGYGRNKINASMVYGGPQLMAESVANAFGIAPDYVFTTSFWGFSRMVWTMGGVRVWSQHSFAERLAKIHRGWNQLNGVEALVFVRQRHQLPGGDFDRSRNQGRFLIDGLRRALTVTQDPGALERLLYTFVGQTDIDIGPVELYRLSRGVLRIDPSKVKQCVIGGTTGYAGGASVVYPNLSQAHDIARRAGRDGRLEGGC